MKAKGSIQRNNQKKNSNYRPLINLIYKYGHFSILWFYILLIFIVFYFDNFNTAILGTWSFN